MNKIFFIILLIAVISCHKTIEIEIPLPEKKPVINCVFKEGEPFKVYVSTVIEPRDTLITNIKNAIVEIEKPDGQKVQLLYGKHGYYTTNAIIPGKGDLYKITVTVDDMSTATAQSMIPNEQIIITGIESKRGLVTVPVMGTGDEGKIKVQNLKVHFKQHQTNEDYMGISTIIHPISHNHINDSILITEQKDLFIQGFLRTNDPGIKAEGLENYYESGILLFKDLLFNKEDASITFNVEKETPSAFWLHFFLFSPEAFKYTKSWIVHYYTQDYDFWEVYEPQPLYSNIENGYGIFAGYSAQMFEVWPDSTSTSTSLGIPPIGKMIGNTIIVPFTQTEYSQP